MSEFVFTPEQKEAWDFIEKRRSRFVERMKRVADSNGASLQDTCDCCGYPDLYMFIDDVFPCIVCDWFSDSYEKPNGMRYGTSEEGLPLNLAQARLNFLLTTLCYGSSLPAGWKIPNPPERQMLINSLDALEADTEPANDMVHWAEIRKTFNALAFKVFSREDFERLGCYPWGFAAKADPFALELAAK